MSFMVVPDHPSPLAQWAPFQALTGAFAKGDPCLSVDGLWGSSRGLVVAALVREVTRPALVLVPDLPALGRMSRDLRFFGATLAVPPAQIVEFPPSQPLFWRGGRRREEAGERAVVCQRLLRGEPLTAVATPASLASPLLSPEGFRRRSFSLKIGTSLAREELLERLETAGYERVETVVEMGQWSLRGGIVDIFSPARDGPVRVEFFGDEVESLRLFDPSSQRSVEPLERLEVLPLALGEGPGATLLSYLTAEAPVILDGPALLEAPPDDAPSAVPLSELLKGRQRIELGLWPVPASDLAACRFTLETRSVASFRGQFRQLAAELGHWLREGFRVRLICQDETQAHRLKQILLEHGLEAVPGAALWGPEGLGILAGECAQGFGVPALGLILLTEEELFGARRRTLRRPLYQRGAALTAFTDLEVGDLVVHEEHGIGRYLGLKTLPVDGRQGDFLLLEYAEGNRLYLPVERLSVISKYLGGAGATVRLDRLGGSSWQRVKESVRAALRRMAEELLQLYAARTVLEGHGFGAETPWQREFEAAFRFEETPDQLRAIEEVKADMEGCRPMDRLVAGDVGYGKTEIALRAAFKAALEGKQVALLVPTTILAQQHGATFAERFAPFPLRVELLSRFRSPREQKAVVAGLRQGTVDVVIGTHRLLSRDVAFRDLGLLIVDEEHRFGVAHKERIKQLRKAVDVLTLTATPIPRTLYMSLSGVRDLSTIETPPPDRLPVETVVAPFSRTLIREALERELSRGGQVFFVHNRVQSLPSMTAFIRRLVPQARVEMAHGQMRERDLEQVMLRFVGGQADVLVSTAIVESGLDIPASNTIIVNRADRFGLAQLYQLRGRVGRERQQAYAYLLIPADGRIDETAQKRLRVIQELTELGSGFRLALRDLEIRGAGNLLGPEQHGHIAAVGFDLYSKLLAEAVRELKGEPAEAALEPVVTVEVEALLPETYVREVTQRLALYKRLAGVTRMEEIAEIRAELRDRFGPLLPPVEHLLEVIEIRALARQLGIERVEAVGGRALLTFAPSTPVSPERLIRAIREAPGRLRLKKEFVVEAPIPREPWPLVRKALGELLGMFR
ncbi:MAG: transcription-repair coupling factor [Candidatus Rokubacteria bacterium]|nr:transcription-repair coupling factor [Candidatus Rokubacteria bacterium]